MSKAAKSFLIAVLFGITAFSPRPALGDQLRDAVEALERNDFNRAFQLMLPLAEGGNAQAQGFLGDMYNAGQGVARDLKKALVWWKRAAEKGEPYSQLSLGDNYAAGRGVKEDFSEAAKWWRKAAEQNIPRAQVGLGLALYQGRGIQQDKSEAAKWFLKAADQDEVQAQAMLARMYATGEGGLTQSFLEAYKWIVIAGDAAPQLTMPTKMMLETAMRKTQQQEAIRLAEQWKFDKGKTKIPPQAASKDDVAGVHFVNLRQLSDKCTSTGANDLLWCDAYIAGVVDTLGSGRSDLAGDAKEALFCLRKKVSLRQARQAVSKVINQMQEDKDPVLLNSPASNSVIAGILVHLCK